MKPITNEIDEVMGQAKKLDGHKPQAILCGIDAYDLWCHEQDKGDILVHQAVPVDIVSALPRYAILVTLKQGLNLHPVVINTEIYA